MGTSDPHRTKRLRSMVLSLRANEVAAMLTRLGPGRQIHADFGTCQFNRRFAKFASFAICCKQRGICLFFRIGTQNVSKAATEVSGR
jgi:hypothetical protein